MKKPFYWLITLGAILLAACSSAGAPAEPPVTENDEADTAVSEPSTKAENERFSADKYADYEMVTLLPRDAIPAIDNPQFLSADDADEKYDPDELIIGVEFNGDARAYSVPLLSRHEIVNDTVGDEKIAVTW